MRRCAMPTVDDALSLARAGWEVLPLHGKVPITAHGVLDASSDETTVRAWWRNGDHNIGARVPARAVVLDIDPQNGGTLAALEHAAGGPLPATLTVHSGRGTGGRHCYFLHPGTPVSSRRLPTGIDVKTARGYCVMPPSLHPATGQPYRWQHADLAPLPSVLAALLAPPPAPHRTARAAPSSSDALARRAAYLARHVEQLPEGNRNAGLYWAACRAVDEGHPAETFDLLEGAALVAGLDEFEAQRTIASARRGAGS